MNIFSVSHILEGLTPLSIDSARCVRIKSPLSRCRSCEDICPVGALHFADGHWQAQDCVSCGLCVGACPAQVFALDEGVLLQAAEKAPDLAISCRQGQDTPLGQVQISCYWQLYPELVLRLLDKVQSLTLHYHSQNCARCAHAWQAQSLLLPLAQYHLPLDKLHLKDAALNEDAPVNSQRRHFLQGFWASAKKQTQKAAAHSAEEVLAQFQDEDEPSATEIVAKRVALRKLYQQNAELDRAQELPYRRLKADRCTFCNACTRLCPTGALTLFAAKDESKALCFQSVLCIACDLCADVCLPKGLYWSDRLTIAEFLDNKPQILAESDKKICTQCQQDFWQYPAGDDVCAFCRR